MTTTAPPTTDRATRPALAVEDLSVELRTPSGAMRAVDTVTFSVASGETVALLGESGCGKSLTAGAIIGLLDPAARVAGGSVRVDGADLLTLSPTERRMAAGPKVSAVFQDALTTLNPVQPVWRQLAEPFVIHRGLRPKDAKKKAIEMMDLVGIPQAAKRAGGYPHQFSGGLRQRLVIAAAVALQPRVLIADEPTTALDVTVQAQIMKLLGDLRREFSIGVVLITHDLAVVAEEADHVAVMYAGTIVERGPVDQVFGFPRHPYTQGLLDSVPVDVPRHTQLHSIGGTPPEVAAIPSGCVFQARCPHTAPICRDVRPNLEPQSEDVLAACHLTKEISRVRAS